MKEIVRKRSKRSFHKTKLKTFVLLSCTNLIYNRNMLNMEITPQTVEFDFVLVICTNDLKNVFFLLFCKTVNIEQIFVIYNFKIDKRRFLNDVTVDIKVSACPNSQRNKKNLLSLHLLVRVKLISENKV